MQHKVTLTEDLQHVYRLPMKYELINSTSFNPTRLTEVGPIRHKVIF